MQIKHEKIPTTDDKVGLDDWVADHIVSGFPDGTFQMPKLIEKKTLSSGSSITTFSGLNGNSSEKYLIEIDLIVTASGGEPVLHCRPNNDNGNNYSNKVARLLTSWGVGNNWSDPDSVMGAMGATANDRMVIRSVATVKSGARRIFSNRCDTIHALMFVTMFWNNTTDNITSLVFFMNNGTFEGTIRLYELVDQPF